MKRKDVIFWSVTALVVCAVGVLYMGSQHFSIRNSTLQFDGKDQQQIDIPFTIGSQGRWATVTFDIRMPPFVPADFIIYADDCLRDVQINGQSVEMSYDCELVRKRVDLGAYLRTGENHVVVRIEDFGGVTEFSIQGATSYLVYVLLNICCITVLYIYSIYYFRNGKRK